MLRKAKLHLLLAAATLVATGGCAKNALRVEYARNVATSGTVAVAASREFLGQVEAAKMAMNVDLIAADPACSPHVARVRTAPRVDSFKDPKAPPRGWLCFPPGSAAGPGEFRELRLTPLGRELEPTLTLTAALASYSSALEKIVDADAPDPVQDLEDALKLARSGENLLRTLAGSADRWVPAADDDRLTAVAGFIRMITELRHEADKVARLRKLIATEPASANLVAELREHLALWDTARAGFEGTSFNLLTIVLNRSLSVEPPLTAEARRSVANTYYSASAARAAAAQLHPALDATLSELAEADADMRRVLQKNPKLTPEERERVAAIARERFVKAFDQLTSLLLAFKGA